MGAMIVKVLKSKGPEDTGISNTSKNLQQRLQKIREEQAFEFSLPITEIGRG